MHTFDPIFIFMYSYSEFKKSIPNDHINLSGKHTNIMDNLYYDEAILKGKAAITNPRTLEISYTPAA